MPTRRQLNLRYELPAHTDLSDKYDFLYDYNTRKGYVALKDSDDWREIENMSDEVRSVISKLPEPDPELEGIPLKERWRSKEHLQKMKQRIEREKKHSINSSAFNYFLLSFNPANIIRRVKTLIRLQRLEKFRDNRTASNGLPMWYYRKGGRLISRNPINRFKLK